MQANVRLKSESPHMGNFDEEYYSMLIRKAEMALSKYSLSNGNSKSPSDFVSDAFIESDERGGYSEAELIRAIYRLVDKERATKANPESIDQMMKGIVRTDCTPLNEDKVCCTCKNPFPTYTFPTYYNSKTGRHCISHQCRGCKNKAAAKYGKTAKAKAAQQRWRAKAPDVYMATLIARRPGNTLTVAQIKASPNRLIIERNEYLKRKELGVRRFFARTINSKDLVILKKPGQSEAEYQKEYRDYHSTNLTDQYVANALVREGYSRDYIAANLEIISDKRQLILDYRAGSRTQKTIDSFNKKFRKGVQRKGKARPLKYTKKYWEQHREELSDRYVIKLLTHKQNKVRYTAAYLKAHPEIIEARRRAILERRAKRPGHTIPFPLFNQPTLNSKISKSCIA